MDNAIQQPAKGQASMAALLDRRRYLRNLVRDVNEVLSPLPVASLHSRRNMLEEQAPENQYRNES